MKSYSLKTDKLIIEVLPAIHNPWATAYYGPGENDHVTVIDHLPEHYRDQNNESKCLSDLLAILYGLLLVKVDDVKDLLPMCHLDNFSYKEIGEDTDFKPMWDQLEEYEKDLKEGHELCLESIKELNLFHVPKAGPQIELF